MTVKELQAGRELDALVAEKVMGLKPHRMISCPDNKPGCLVYHYEGAWEGYVIPDYSTSISAAWEVVEKLGVNDFVHLSWMPGHKLWTCSLDSTMFGGYINLSVEADTAPLAICRAALKVVEG